MINTLVWVRAEEGEKMKTLKAILMLSAIFILAMTSGAYAQRGGQSGGEQPYYWYFCQDPQGYYPYVKNCPGGWMQVVPQMTPPNMASPKH